MKKLFFLLLLCITTSASAQFFTPQQKPMLGLQVNGAHPLAPTAGWLFNEVVGGQVFDLSGNNNDGTFFGTPSWVSGKYGSAIYLPGSDDYIKVDDSPTLDFPAGFTIYSIVKPDVVNVLEVICYRYDAGSQDGYYLQKTTAGNGIWEFYVFQGGGADNATSNVVATGGTQHIAAVREGNGDLKLYVDGMLQADIGSMSGVIDSSDPLYIGCNNALIRDWAGNIELLLIYNRALLPSEIAQLYREPFCFMQPSWNWVLYGGISVGTKTGQVIFINMN